MALKASTSQYLMADNATLHHSHIHVGVAVVDEGLVVPVVKHTDALSQPKLVLQLKT